MTISSFLGKLLSMKIKLRRSYLNAGPPLLLEQNILWLHITVYNFVSPKRVQALEQTVGELPNQLERKPLEFVLLDQLVQVYRQKLEGYTSVTPEKGEILVSNRDMITGVLF